MTIVSISLPELLNGWIEERIASGDYASASDYICDLVRHDRARRQTVDDQVGRLRASSGDTEALDYIDAAFTPE